jgi:UrcA family protein
MGELCLENGRRPKMTRRLAFVSAFLFASLSVSTGCFAQPIGDGIRLVRFDDLDLSTEAGVAKLDRRIRRAADWVCLDPASTGPVAKVNSACRARALKDARLQMAEVVAKQRLKTAAAGQPHPSESKPGCIVRSADN